MAKHCNRSECITTRRMGSCECFCLDCNQPDDDRTTLELQYEEREWSRLSRAQKLYAEVNGLRGKRADDIRRKFQADATASTATPEWERYLKLRRALEHPELTHAFVRSVGDRPGPRDETCEICGTDPRNQIHAALQIEKVVATRETIASPELPDEVKQFFDDHGIESQIVGRAADGTLEVEASVPAKLAQLPSKVKLDLSKQLRPTVLPLTGDGVGMSREESDAALRVRIKAAAKNGGRDALGDAYRELKESMSKLDDAIFGWSDKPGERVPEGELRETRNRCCKAVIADAMYLLEQIKEAHR